MKGYIKVKSLSDGRYTHESVELSAFCPCCGIHLHPTILSSFMTEYDNETFNTIYILNFCPKCNECFISKHTFDSEEMNGYTFHSSAPMSPFNQDFSENIADLSPDFVKIYNESFYAEQLGLVSICGMGYRKALEFLVKDYIISKNPESKNIVSSKMLASCINEFISDEKLKALSKASAWIGNDETHYIRKHVDYNVKNLKAFIDADCAYEEASRLLSST